MRPDPLRPEAAAEREREDPPDRARPDARRFYESLGFKASHDGMKLSL